MVTRINTLDLWRGVAILGILFANIPGFNSSSYEFMLGESEAANAPVNNLIDSLRTTFVSGKFRSILAILIGIGLALQFQKRKQAGFGWPGGYVRRTLALALIGLLHTFFLWTGDILLIYSLAILGCMWLLSLQDRAFNILTAVAVGLMLLIGLAVSGLFAASELLGMNIEAEITKGYESEIAQETWAFTQGTYWDQFQYRASYFAKEGYLGAIFSVLVAPLILFGAWMGRMGPRMWNAVLTPALARFRNVCLGIGVPLNLCALLFMLTGVPISMYIFVETVAAPLLSMGVVCAALVSGPATMHWPAQLVANVGRMAMTCYLLESAICSVLFYSWGGQLYGKLNEVQLIGVAVSVNLAIMMIAFIWLSKFKIGPIEWVHRALSGDRRRRPMIKFEV